MIGIIEEYCKKHYLNLKSFSDYVQQHNIQNFTTDSPANEYIKTVCGGIPIYGGTGLPSTYSICEKCGNFTEDINVLGRKCAAKPDQYIIHRKNSTAEIAKITAISENIASSKLYNYLNSRNLQKDYHQYDVTKIII